MKFLVYVPFLQDEKMSYIFKHGTELGITDFVVVEYERCKYKLPKKDYEKKLIRWNKIIKEASEQSYRIHKPNLERIINVKEVDAECCVNIMCSLDKTDVKKVCKVLTTQNCDDTISLVFGPEGGLSKNEEDLLSNKGFIKTSLGEDVLRTETVPLMIASIVKYLRDCD
jgi:16S rRNA (uracil1498-N3)-methyltransferase